MMKFYSSFLFVPMMKSFSTFLILFFITAASFAQEGYLRGKILDETSGETLIGATVVKQGTTQGSVSDFDGNYSLKLEAGTHTIVFSSVGFKSVTIQDVEVKANETTILDLTMAEDVEQLGEVVITAEAVKDNDIGVLLVQKKSVNTLDGISSNTFGKIGDSNLSSAMGRVTGVSIQDGKYVYVRGLGDRYTKTSINGMIIPGLDPDRNDVQIDIFPTGILENVLVYKTFSPDLSGSFTGGLVDIQTKSFPDRKSTSLSLSLGYNPDMHFNSDYLTYEGSSTDWLGYDNGARDLPVTAGEELPSNNEVTSQFDPTLGATRQNSFMNTSFSFSHRNQIKGNRITWGYNALFNYRNTFNYFEDFELRRYERRDFGDGPEILRDYTAKGDLASNEVLWSGLVSVAGKMDNTTIGTTFLHIQNGISTSLDRTRSNSSLNNPTFLYNDIITYTQRSLSDFIVYGKHKFGRLRMDWTNSLIFSRQYEPDYREININEDDGVLGFRNGGFINRFWRDLDEVNESFRLDFEYDLNKSNKLKFGGAGTFRNREFTVFNYDYDNLNSQDVRGLDVNDPDPNQVLRPDNIISPDNPNGPAINNSSLASNLYDGKQTILAGYVMNEMSITEKLKSVYGVRLESATMLYSGIIKGDNTVPERDVEDLETLNETNLLPSVSMIYSLNENMNLRASFNKTLARPSFKEKSEAFIDDPINGIFFIGNIDLKQAEILNYDLRWEYFLSPGELFSASLFYKDFTNHIAIVAFDVDPEQVKPRNVGEAYAYGSELEVRKNLTFISPLLKNFQVGSNFTYTISRVDRETVLVGEPGPNGEEAANEYQSELNTFGNSREIERYRNMSGQAPYSINGFLNYENDNGLSANLSYNVQGETLTIVSASEVPEIYTKPFHSLSLKVGKAFGEDDRQSVSLRIQNMLDDDNELVYKLDDEERLFRLRSPGRLFTLKYTYNF